MFEKVSVIVKAAMGWAKTIPSEPNGHGSSSRVIALSVAFTVVGVIIAYFAIRHELPSSDQLYGLAAILGTGISGYVSNCFRRKGSSETPDNPDSGGGQ
jgi:hypothetical protein